ncbi:hypothetical protein ENSA7_11810 [Enhygromyxa salina]|uniref:Uncharacterized protein n=2 Tax=Enhygromyxa salina TaxID=215803 RepID=A0A2S9YVQ4_9BACT|nr:hypothetical protein ENSA7_11810 [Enhygromyxa salina]
MGPPSWASQETPDLCVLYLPATFSFTGDLDGSFTDCEFYIEHYGPCDQPAPEYFASEGVWAGEVLGGEGGFAFTFEGEIDVQGNALGDLTIDGASGTGELEGVGGTITLDGVTGVGGSYAGQVELE